MLTARHRVLVVYDKLQLTVLNGTLISKIDWHEVTAPYENYLYNLKTQQPLDPSVLALSIFRILTRQSP
jgi:hypothetical protein